MRTLPDNGRTERHERRTALVAKELARYNVDIGALSETRLPDKGHITEHEAYSHYISRRLQ